MRFSTELSDSQNVTNLTWRSAAVCQKGLIIGSFYQFSAWHFACAFPLEHGEGCLKTVAVIDDDADVLDSLRDLLEAIGVQPVCFGSPIDAVRTLEEQPVDAILVDVRMPEMDGFEVVRCLQVSKANARTRVILLTGNDTTQALDESEGLSAEMFLAKPVSLETLNFALEEISAKRIQ